MNYQAYCFRSPRPRSASATTRPQSGDRGSHGKHCILEDLARATDSMSVAVSRLKPRSMLLPDHETTMFFHDVPPDVTAEAAARVERGYSPTPFLKPWALSAWPNVPTRFLLCRDDRFFPAEFMRRVVRERLGITPDEMISGHLPALSHPKELVERLEAYRAEQSCPIVRSQLATHDLEGKRVAW